MKKYPKIKLKIDIEKDVSNGVNFVKCNLLDGRPEAITQFLPDPFQYVLNKRFSSKERDKIIEEFFQIIYGL